MTHLDKYLRMNVQGEMVIFDASDNTEVPLEDFHRAKGDIRLGRWRSPKYPGYVVYPDTADPRPSSARGRGVTVLDEKLPRLYTVWEERTEEFAHLRKESGNQIMARRAAEAYFEAHPAPKPAWHGAKSNEIWALTLRGADGPEQAYVATSYAFMRDGSALPIKFDDDRIISARRIWPEVAS